MKSDYNFQVQYLALWAHKVLPIEIFLRLTLILQTESKLVALLVIFDIVFLFFNIINFSSNGYEIIFNIVIVYLYQYIVGRVHIFYIFASCIFFNVARKRYWYCSLLIMNISFAAFCMVDFGQWERFARELEKIIFY
jgi:hypothetical protein